MRKWHSEKRKKKELYRNHPLKNHLQQMAHSRLGVRNEDTAAEIKNGKPQI